MYDPSKQLNSSIEYLLFQFKSNRFNYKWRDFIWFNFPLKSSETYIGNSYFFLKSLQISNFLIVGTDALVITKVIWSTDVGTRLHLYSNFIYSESISRLCFVLFLWNFCFDLWTLIKYYCGEKGVKNSPSNAGYFNLI